MKVTRFKGHEWYRSPMEELEKIETAQRQLMAYAIKNRNRKDWYPAWGWERYGKTGD